MSNSRAPICMNTASSCRQKVVEWELRAHRFMLIHFAMETEKRIGAENNGLCIYPPEKKYDGNNFIN